MLRMKWVGSPDYIFVEPAVLREIGRFGERDFRLHWGMDSQGDPLIQRAKLARVLYQFKMAISIDSFFGERVKLRKGDCVLVYEWKDEYGRHPAYRIRRLPRQWAEAIRQRHQLLTELTGRRSPKQRDAKVRQSSENGAIDKSAAKRGVGGRPRGVQLSRWEQEALRMLADGIDADEVDAAMVERNGKRFSGVITQGKKRISGSRDAPHDWRRGDARRLLKAERQRNRRESDTK